MPTERPLFRSFAAGEISPEAFGRIDLDRLQTGLSLCRNFITLPHGPAQNRPGFEYVIETKYSNKRSILLPFVYNDDQAYVLELGDRYMRVHTEGGTLLFSSGSPIHSIDQITSTITSNSHGFNNGDWVSIKGILGMGELKDQYFKIADKTTNTFKLAYLDGNIVDMTNFQPYISSGFVHPVYEIQTPYLEEDLLGIHYTQSADVMTLVHPKYLPREVSRSGAVLVMTSIGFWPRVFSPLTVTATATGAGTKVYRYRVTAIDEGNLEESVASPIASVTNNLAVSGNSNRITWANAVRATRYNVYKEVNGLFGYIGQALDGTTGFVDENITPDLGKTPPVDSNPFAGPGNYPAAVGYFEGRRWFGGTNNRPQGLWATRSGTETNMTRSIPPRDDDSISVYLRSQRADMIRHIVPLADLLLLTSGSEWRVTAKNSDAITPSTISYRLVGAVGANLAQPVVTSEAVIYAQAAGGRVRELVYSWEIQGYKSNDISILASHLFDKYEITGLAYTRSPHQIVWCVRNDGVLLGMTYVPEHKVIGWHQHTTKGSFEAIASIPEGGGDRLYAIVKRNINGRTVRYVERMAARRADTLADSFFVDSGLRYDGPPVTRVRNLRHLEGETVAILADGAVLPQQTVVNGTVTLPSPASKVRVGLPIDAAIGLLPVAFQAPAYGLGLAKNINGVIIRVNNTSGIQAGPDENTLREYQQRTTEPYGSPPNPTTGVIEIAIDSSWNYDGVVYIKQPHPLPATILAAALDLVY